MFTELRIVSSTDLTKRCYISFHFNGKRIREFNGNNLGIDIKPNRASTIHERDRLLRKLEHELLKALESENYPVTKQTNDDVRDPLNITTDTQTLLQYALDSKLNSDLAKFYKRNMTYMFNDFTAFLSPTELSSPITNLKPPRIEEFLTRYKSSGTYYMNKRRDLGVLFSSIEQRLEIQLPAVHRTNKMKSKAKLHKIYTQDQLNKVLEYLKDHHQNLYMCCILSYGCFLRPHREIRKLQGHHFKNDCREIHLSGNENKSGRVRIVPIPQYARIALLPRLNEIAPNENLFSRSKEPFNEAYFSTSWTRIWNKMSKASIIEEDQTLYSFRHTAAVYVYRKTKDIHVVQQLLGHSDMIVTLNYLRGLGEVNLEEQKQYMPEL